MLSLDGGGAKGFYTIGVLRELEALVGKTLGTHFDLIFGTSTGAIIAALLALGKEVSSIQEVYREHVPTVMKRWTRRRRSIALANLARDAFGTHSFSDVTTGLGIVATRWDFEHPMIFKGDVTQAHGRRNTFVPGFGCTIVPRASRNTLRVLTDGAERTSRPRYSSALARGEIE